MHRATLAILASSLVLGGAVLGACGGSSGVDASDAGAGVDVAIEAASADASATDASDAGNANDGGAAADAKTTDATSLDAGPSFCDFLDAQPAFCDDFDHGAVGATWDAIVDIAPGTATLDPLSASAPFSLLVQTAPQAGTTFGTVLLRKTATVASPVTHARLAFAFNPAVATPATGSLGIATLDLSMSHLFTLYLRDTTGMTGPSLVETTGTDTRFALSAVPPLGAWTRVVLDLDLTNAKANVFFGATHVLTDATITTGSGTEPTIRIGALLEGPAAAYPARFDDVTLDVQ